MGSSKKENNMKYLIFIISLFLLFKCTEIKQLGRQITYTSPYDRYLASLKQAGLKGTAMVKAWTEQGQKALLDTIEVVPPYEETGYFTSTRIQARGYRIQLKEGQQLSLDLKTNPRNLNIFLDVFQAQVKDGEIKYESIIAVDTSKRQLEYEIKSSGEYIIRLQPELFTSGRYDFSITLQPSFSFPVDGKGNEAIWSFWGDPRGGGTRKHEGIDIFAARGTPVLAVTDGIISSVRNAGLGGKQVWLRDGKRGQSIYYAHLDSQLVMVGESVKRLDTVGLIGNTGNASKTRPHLHFGIYKWQAGALDPLPFVYEYSQQLPTLQVDTSLIGKLAKTKNRSTDLRQSADKKATRLAQIERHTALQVEGATGNWYRVRLPDESLGGFIYKTSIQKIETPIRKYTVKDSLMELQISPLVDAAPLGRLITDEKVTVLAKLGDFDLVETTTNRGWVRMKKRQ